MGFENQVTGSMGTKISVCAELPNDNTKAAWKALDAQPGKFVRVKGVTDGGEYGASYELGSEAQLEDGVLMKWKGVQNAGSASLALLILKGDPGQAILAKAGEGNPEDPEDKSAYNPIGVKYEFTNGDVDYFAALVMGWPKAVGGANDAVKSSPTLELIARAIRIPAEERAAAQEPDPGQDP